MSEDNQRDFDDAYRMASILAGRESAVAEEQISEAVGQVLNMPQFANVDSERLRKELEANFNIQVGGYQMLSDLDFRPWLQTRKETTEFKFWRRYRRFLEEEKKYPRAVITQLDNITDDILDRLRAPDTEGAWDRRGLVVGDVQSGKTSNYTGLICKAVDAGYRLVIILAGMHNSLRSQTQLRIDEGFLGFDTRFHLEFDKVNQRTGVGLLSGEPLLVAQPLTSSQDNGDFKRNVAAGMKIIPGGQDPLIFVVKKHCSVLNNLLNWALSVRGEAEPESPNGKIIRGVPLLLIDDEADYASANTKPFLDEDGNVDPETDPSRTNELIRKLLSAFDQSCYIGYTATPFANIFMHHEAYSDAAGEDLFPRSFIVNIPAPSNYIGPEKIFGLDEEGRDTASGGLPIIRDIPDSSVIFPLKHNKRLQVDDIPESLKRALLSFILSSAARRARGHRNSHNSMLVHVTRFTNVQGQVAEHLRSELEDMRRQLEYGPGAGGSVMEELRKLWESDYVTTSTDVADLLPDHDLPPVSWTQIEPELFHATDRMQVREINGSAKDALDYHDHEQGLSVIAVGGDKLSRGLTLEGLTVSYFVRTSRMYDTLMQMGRWFGYRPGYADLCRLYTTEDLKTWYRHIATAMAELRQEFDNMCNRGLTPLDFGHRVQTHPDGLLITAANKMRASWRRRVGFAGTISETVAFDLDGTNVGDNYKAFEQFLESLGPPETREGKYVWENIEGEKVADLLASVSTAAASWKANSRAMSDYVRDRLSQNTLRSWTVAVPMNGKGARAEIAGHELQQIRRTNRSNSSSRYTIGRLVSPEDEMVDLDDAQRTRALENTLKAWRKSRSTKSEPVRPSGPMIREQRDRDRGLLIIYPIDRELPEHPQSLMGFATSFPADITAKSNIEYAENSVRQLEMEFD